MSFNIGFNIINLKIMRFNPLLGQAFHTIPNITEKKEFWYLNRKLQRANGLNNTKILLNRSFVVQHDPTNSKQKHVLHKSNLSSPQKIRSFDFF